MCPICGISERWWLSRSTVTRVFLVFSGQSKRRNQGGNGKANSYHRNEFRKSSALPWALAFRPRELDDAASFCAQARGSASGTSSGSGIAVQRPFRRRWQARQQAAEFARRQAPTTVLLAPLTLVSVRLPSRYDPSRLIEQAHEVRAVAAFHQRLGSGPQLVITEEPQPPRNLFRRTNDQSLSFLYGPDKI